MLFYFTAFLVTVIDQVSKQWVRSHMEVGESFIVNSMLHFTYYENTGMAHSLFQGYARIFAIIAVIFVAGIWYYRRKGEFRGKLMDISTGLLVGGAVGNAIDRFLFGRVVDFLEFKPGRGILNMADVALSLGVLVMLAGVLMSALNKKKEETTFKGEAVNSNDD
ncbi:signal peptidase II [Paenibacillus eucommiae]|uniref:Lipoprotein signal peptidase n=1 Tax=Paenibacillus eucommiae TaxID=1355755 RepID=A0ABS4IRW8_9BACL|nr:signal peptidase II [Paenibacillus eucommiae]MBP1990324.1 signal peptidase II [Paenibacillus eucommiae]